MKPKKEQREPSINLVRSNASSYQVTQEREWEIKKNAKDSPGATPELFDCRRFIDNERQKILHFYLSFVVDLNKFYWYSKSGRASVSAPSPWQATR